MLRVPVCALSLAAAVLVSPAFGQAVVSTHSGVVHFFEGTVTVAGQPLESRFGRFTAIPDGADLRTEQGRAEILLTPGVILRVGENSAIRMTSTSLADTRVEVLAGTAIMEAGEPAAGTSVTLTYKNWSIRQAHAGVYRVYCDPPKLQVREGSVEVAAAGDAPVTVENGMDLPLEKVLAPEKSPTEPNDAFTDWADGRAQSISADNAIAADIQDPANMTGDTFPADAFTYYPLLGFPPPMAPLGSYGGSYGSVDLGTSGLYTGIYGTSPLYQPGFYSIYLPGYTYRPVFLRLPVGIGGLGHSLLPPLHPIGTPGYTMPGYTRPGYTMPGYTIPRYPTTRPIGATPRPAITAPHPAIHIGK